MRVSFSSGFLYFQGGFLGSSPQEENYNTSVYIYIYLYLFITIPSAQVYSLTKKITYVATAEAVLDARGKQDPDEAFGERLWQKMVSKDSDSE